MSHDPRRQVLEIINKELHKINQMADQIRTDVEEYKRATGYTRDHLKEEIKARYDTLVAEQRTLAPLGPSHSFQRTSSGGSIDLGETDPKYDLVGRKKEALKHIIPRLKALLSDKKVDIL
jgi:hypothetical protein